MFYFTVRNKPARNYATLKRFRPEDADEGDDWMRDPAQVQEANQRWHDSIAPSVPKQHFSSEAQSKRRREFLNSQYLEILEDTILKAQKSGYIMLFWRSPDAREHKFKIFLNFLKHPSGQKALCRINFVQEGIKVTKVNDEESHTLLDLMKIKGHVYGTQLLQLWGHELQRLTGHFPEEAQVPIPSMRPGRNMIKVCNKTLEQWGAIQENDSVFILQTFLDRYYPQGGTLCFMPEEFYSSLERLNTTYNFSTFIDAYSYFLENDDDVKIHPLYSEHIAWLANPKYIRYFMENIKLLRPGTETLTEKVKLIGTSKYKAIKMLTFE